MQKLALGLVAVAGLATVAAARPDPKLSLQFSTDNATWVDDINVTPGTPVFVQVVMSIPDANYGISGARYNVISTNAGGWDNGGDDQIDLSAAKGSATDGRIGGFDFGGQTQQVFEAANSLRIDAKGDTGNSVNAGISTSQNTPGALGTNFNTNKVAAVYKFRVVLSGNTATRDITFMIRDGVNGTPDEITSFKAYETSGSTSGTQLSGELGDVGNIHIEVPAPGALALVGIGGLAAARRRR
ncbi:MAG: PEP-CTERM sorting domain-containing protein [Phycisphaerales bacterium]|nr:PEP-CTERM sorting domain-containing protein [Phycisphaerales bacterium]